MLYTIFVKYRRIFHIVLGIFLIYTVKKVSSDSYKLRKCENAMKKTLENILQRSDDKNSLLLTPFHETIAKFKNDSEAYQRTMWGCFSIFRFEKCLSILEDSHQKNIKLASIKHWKEICNYARERKEDFLEFLNCERRHIFKTKTHCAMPSKEHNQTTLEIFCENLYEYNRCYRSIDKRCSESALEISYILDEAVIESYTNVVKLAAYIIQIPNTCNWIMKPNIREISKNKYKESRESKKQEKDAYALSNQKNTTYLNYSLKKEDIENIILNTSDNNLVDKHNHRHHHKAKNSKLLITTSTLKTDIHNDEDNYEHVSIYKINDTYNYENEIFTDIYEEDDNISTTNDPIALNNEVVETTTESNDDIFDNTFSSKLNSSHMIVKIENSSIINPHSSISGLVKNKSNYIYIGYQYILLITILFILFFPLKISL
uniref:CPG4 domain-containing protein n=1 Tax=Strongyloides papillosus TaxID=174720 RepID=A0A0N5BK40_STREA